MNRIYHLLTALVLTITAQAQTLNVVVGDVTYRFPAAQTGEMDYDSGTKLTILGRTFEVNDITRMYIDDTDVTDNHVDVSYDDNTAKVCIAGNVARYVEPTVIGVHVTLTQSDDVNADNVGEITYSLSGTSTDGGFCLTGSYKSTVELCGLKLTNPNGAAIDIQNGKRVNISVKKDTENTLTDGAGTEQKACLVVKGHAEFKGKGTLNVYGNTAHGIKTGDYMSVKNCTINVLSAVKDGIHCNEYFLMESGEVNVSGTGDDGLQAEIDGTESTGMTEDHEDEDSGNIYIVEGNLNISVSAEAAKGINADGDISVSGGNVNVNTSGNGTWDSEALETKAAAGMSSDGNVTLSGGVITLTSTGSGGKGVKCDGNITISGGIITVKTSGGLYYSNRGSSENHNYTGNTDNLNSSYYSSPKGIKAGGDISINGGDISVTTTGRNAEGIESKAVITISDGTVNVNAYDDALNSKSHMYLKGGTVTAVATNNDGIDSNGNMYISGGTIIACGSSAPECGIDAAEQYHLYITGGNVLGIGGGNNAVTATTGSQCVLSTQGSVSGGSTISVRNGSTTLASFTIPSSYTGSTQGGPGGPGGGQGGCNLLISCDGLVSGSSYTVYSGSTSLGSATASTSSSDNMGGGGSTGGGGNPGGGGPGGGGHH